MFRAILYKKDTINSTIHILYTLLPDLLNKNGVLTDTKRALDIGANFPAVKYMGL